MTASRIADLRELLARHGAAALDLVWPPSCSACGQRARRPADQFCEACWDSLRPVGDPLAPRLLAAFAVDSLFLAMLTTSKYARFRAVGRRLARESAAAIAKRIRASALQATLVPVPLTRARRRERGFNQAEDFARAIAVVSDLPVATDWLVRVRGGPPVAGRLRAERRSVVAGAFAATRELAGQRDTAVAIVDDVFTTGATLADCERAVRAVEARVILRVVMGRAFAASTDAPVRPSSFLERL